MASLVIDAATVLVTRMLSHPTEELIGIVDNIKGRIAEHTVQWLYGPLIESVLCVNLSLATLRQFADTTFLTEFHHIMFDYSFSFSFLCLLSLQCSTGLLDEIDER